MRIAVLHAYSSANAGDGLLVEESIRLLQDAFGSDCRFVVAASDPDSFAHLDVRVVDSRPRRFRYDRTFLRFLRRLDTADLVVGVGGGYLRAGRLLESAKTAAVHLPQLVAAARAKTVRLYLPQSIGPARPGAHGLLRTLLGRLDVVLVRDDRTRLDFALPNMARVPDLALLKEPKGIGRIEQPVSAVPVVSTRAIRGRPLDRVTALAARLACFDGYVQSTHSGNDDRAAMAALGPRRIVSRSELMSAAGARRVVVAVRLHAALMALDAGHLVIHLAYERKGFGAFDDLGLPDFVHNVNRMDVDLVLEQIRRLSGDAVARHDYDETVRKARPALAESRRALIEEIRTLRPVGSDIGGPPP